MSKRRRITRWLAPIALIGVVGAVLVVVNNSDVGTKSDKSSNAQTITGASGSPKAKKKRGHHERTYTVKAGDTLSAIAEKTGVSLAVIERLNPDIDAQTLHAGQKIKLVAS